MPALPAQVALAAAAAAAGVALAQSPGEGVSKVSVAAETDPLAAMAFLQKYFGTTPTDETCQGNVCPCSESDDVQGFTQLPISDSPPGTCLLLLEEPAGRYQADRSTVSVYPSRTPGKGCKYEDATMLSADGDHSYEVSAHSSDQCCKACEAVADCKAAAFQPPGSGRRLDARAYEGFGLHFPGRAPHKGVKEDEFSADVQKLEEIFTKKAGEMKDFDAFMDYNVGLWTSNMDGYVKKLDAGGVPYFAAKWPAPKENEEMYSLFVHVPTTQVFIELMSFFSVAHASQYDQLLSLEQRLSDAGIEAMKEHPPRGDTLQPVKVSRAATDMEALEKFYVDGMKAENVLSQTLGEGSYTISTACYQWPEGKAEVCFVQRPDGATTEGFKVADYERTLKSSAEKKLVNPYCNAFRWKDNHYAVDLVGDFEHILQHIENDDSIKFQCREGRLRYVYDPTGWAVKLNMLFSRCPYSCPEAEAKKRSPSGTTASGAASPHSTARRLLVEGQCDLGECDAVEIALPKECAKAVQADPSLLGVNCSQCELLVKGTCAGGMTYCHKCAAAHLPEWHSIGCAAAGCEESLSQLCVDSATDQLTGEIQKKFHQRGGPASGPPPAGAVSSSRVAAWVAGVAATAALTALAFVGLRRIRAQSGGGVWTRVLRGGME